MEFEKCAIMSGFADVVTIAKFGLKMVNVQLLFCALMGITNIKIYQYIKSSLLQWKVQSNSAIEVKALNGGGAEPILPLIFHQFFFSQQFFLFLLIQYFNNNLDVIVR